MHPSFEQAIFDEPDFVGHYAASGDWLHDRGDPHGEFIQVQLALEDPSCPPARREALRQRERDLLARHQDEWLGPLAPFLRDTPDPEGAGSACRGFLHTLYIYRLDVALGRALRDAWAARFLRELVIESDLAEGEEVAGDDLPGDRGNRWYPFLGLYPLLGAFDFRCLRSFRLGPEPEEEDNTSGWSDCWTSCYIVPELVRRMPQLEGLRLTKRAFRRSAT